MGEVLPVSSFNQSKPMKFIIDRTKWLRGEGDDLSFLIRVDDYKMCCLGQVGIQCGIPEDVLTDEHNPSSILLEKRIQWPEPLRPVMNPKYHFTMESELSGAMMRVNDDEALSDYEREAKLIELAAPHGIELEFVN
jgi:hypothetical protein